MTSPARRALTWSHGSAQVLAKAGMLQAVRFDLPNGPFRPFAEATWPPDDPAAQTLPGHMACLGADFVCLPFGGPTMPFETVAAGWEDVVATKSDHVFHGASADAAWTIEETSPETVRLVLEESDPSPIARLVRTVSGVEGEPSLSFSLRIEARRPCRIPIGLHPILRLPESPGGLELAMPFRFGTTFPASADGMGLAAYGAMFDDLTSVPAGDGSMLDLTRLPLDRPCEILVQLHDAQGPIEARFRDAGAGLRIDWPRTILPSLQIWLSDRALQTPPWRGTYRGVGLEPTASLFDFGMAASAASNPVSRRGVATSVAIDPARPLVIEYRIDAFSLPG